MNGVPSSQTRKTPHLQKHSSVIGIENRLTMLQRKVYNVLLYFARPYLLEQHTHVIRVPTLERALGRDSSNRSYLVESIEQLNGFVVRYDVFSKDPDHAHIWNTSAPILSGTKVTSDNTMIVYSFPQVMAPLLAEPNRYGTLPLEVQNRLKGRYTLPLWEHYLDQIGGRRNETEIQFRIDDLRRLLCLEDCYTAFKDLRKRVIDPAHKEINDVSNVGVHWIETVRHKRRVEAVRLKLTRQGRAHAITDRPAIIDDGLSNDAMQDPGLLKRLYKVFDEGAVNRIAGQYDANRIRRNLDYIARYKANVKDLGALTRAAIRDDYAGQESAPAENNVEGTPTEPPDQRVNPGGSTADPASARAYYDRLDADTRERIYARFTTQHKHLLSGFDRLDADERARQIDYLLNDWLVSQQIGRGSSD